MSVRPGIVSTSIKISRGTGADDADATCFGKVRTPRDGDAVSNPYGRNNVGWNLWNMSKRISATQNYVDESHRILSVGIEQGRWSEETAGILTRLASSIEEARGCALAHWRHLKEVVRESDPTLIEPVGADGFSIIKNHGENTVLMERVWSEWRADTSSRDARLLFEEFQRLAGTSS